METKISIRVDDFTKNQLETFAQNESKTLSTYIRELLNEHVSLDLYEDEYEVLESPETYEYPKEYCIDIKPEFEKSYGFTFLLTWLFAKSMNNACTCSKDNLRDLKALVESVIDSSSFSNDLKMEFVKVLNDINRVLVEANSSSNQFYFSIANHQGSFNYYLLMSEVWSVKY
ncbi:hypothetical protein [Winogradskyella marincola]|uniref:CopG family transcriptional regulator n=1 Tax=Winogradskyella marincola TaxID=3037795 RepID=A0ABT6FXV5_9FLAO|nr:hypothetical protein [Winogradskyella sp. YYF002]MDG4714618.1 hypothetical protein [Winogradskyella sp. YYF002]